MNLRAIVRHRARDLVLVAVGVAAPVGLLLVNGAAFVMSHLAEFRLSIGIAAVVSSLALAGLTAQTVLDRVAGFAPDLYARYHRWMVAAAALSVVAWSLLAGWGTYQSMSDATKLPNGYAVLTALWLLALPFALNLVTRRLRRQPRT